MLLPQMPRVDTNGAPVHAWGMHAIQDPHVTDNGPVPIFAKPPAADSLQFHGTSSHSAFGKAMNTINNNGC